MEAHASRGSLGVVKDQGTYSPALPLLSMRHCLALYRDLDKACILLLLTNTEVKQSHVETKVYRSLKSSNV